MASSLQWTEPRRRYSGVEKFPVPSPGVRVCPCWRNIGRRYPPGPRRSPRLRMPAQRNGLPPLRRAHIAQRYPPSPATLLDLVTRKRAAHARPGSVRPRRIAETKSRRPRIADGGLVSRVPRLSAARRPRNSEMRGQAVEFRPLPFRQMAHGRLGQAHLADEAPAMPAHEQAAAHRQLSAEVQLPIEKVAGPGDQFLATQHWPVSSKCSRVAKTFRRARCSSGHWKRDIQEITDFLQLQALAFAQGQHAALQFDRPFLVRQPRSSALGGRAWR